MNDLAARELLPGAPSPLAEEWQALHSATPEAVRRLLAVLVAEHATELASLFYDTLLHDSEAGPLLSHEVVGTRLHGALQNWLRELFPQDAPAEFSALLARQRAIGTVHARVQVPLHLVLRGSRILKVRMLHHLGASALGRDELFAAQAYFFGVLDLALEMMGTAFINVSQQAATTNEAYRFFAMGQDISLERETQRGALLEWSQSVFFALAMGAKAGNLPPISRSGFGLWVLHRASLLFQESSDYRRIMQIIRQIDTEILPAILRDRDAGDANLSKRIDELQARIEEMHFLLREAFQNIIDLEHGRDPLTRTLNRRFMPTILSREIAIAGRGGEPFSVLMVDLDHFKSVNDRLGHQAGDAILRKAAEIILESCRESDFVFRYGGEEFLIIMVETKAEGAIMAAERIRTRIAATEFRLPNGETTRMTISIGVAVFDGHPDYQRLVERADQALYAAKARGRNMMVLLPSQGA